MRRLSVWSWFAAPLALSASSIVHASENAGLQTIAAHGFVLDSSHPRHPGDARRVPVRIRLELDDEVGEAVLELETAEGADANTERYFVRRDRVFQVDASGTETRADSYGDVSAAALAILHPDLLDTARKWRRENSSPGSQEYFAANDVLWRIGFDAMSKSAASATRASFSEEFGDGEELVSYERDAASRVRATSIRSRGREIARFEFEDTQPLDALHFPAGDRRRDAVRVLAERDIRLNEIAPHDFAIDLADFDARVFVFEFADRLIVYEGAFSSANCDAIARVLERRFKKPVRDFAFSHLHPQYICGVRSWIHGGATILVPPSTKPLIEELARAAFSLRPDALASDPKPAQIESVTARWHFEDALNAVDFYQVESAHTDEYLIGSLPRAKIVLSGDLCFFRPGQPLAGRTKLLRETLKKLGLEFERIYCTWPLATLGTKSIVEAPEFWAAPEK